MSKTITPYIFFGGNCEEAMNAYKTILNAEIGMVMHFNQSPDPVPEGMLAPGFENKVMHASFTIGGTEIFASDGCNPDDAGQGFMLHYPIDSTEEGDKIFSALAEGGEVIMPLEKTFWSPYYGMVKDRFGIGWMVSIVGEQP